MVWIILAGIANTLWTMRCVMLLPPRVATRFGPRGEPNGWMSRKGFAAFGILTPLATAAFLVIVGRQTGGVSGAPETMERFAAGLIIFFSLISWSILRSNRRSPARIDYPSLFVSVAALLVFIGFAVGGVSNASGLGHGTGPNSKAQTVR